MNCPLCTGVLKNKVDEQYYVCTCCNAYVKNDTLWFNEAKEKAHYDQHNNDVHDLGYQKFTAPVTNTVLELCSNDMLGLDYGCGKGPVITEQLKKHEYVVDLYDPYFFPNENYLTKTYDFIFSCEVFEHFYNPKEELQKLKNILKTNGYLIIKTHLYNNQTSFTNWYYRRDLTHVFIYTFKTFEYIAKEFGFEMVTLEEKLVVLKKKQSHE